MRVPRIHTINPLSETQTAALDDKGIKHIRDVLRLNVGHHVILFNGDGYDYHGEITELHKRNVLIQIKDKILVECESPLSLHLLQPLCRSDKMDWCLQKATELGVNSITPFISSRVNLNLSHNKIHKKINHWQSVIHSACEQCGRASIPEINAPMDYQTLVASLPEDACKIIANPMLMKIVILRYRLIMIESSVQLDQRVDSAQRKFSFHRNMVLTHSV
jgi:16S rRNA (uracil1498-N3)-methyltransferase